MDRRSGRPSWQVGGGCDLCLVAKRTEKKRILSSGVRDIGCTSGIVDSRWSRGQCYVLNILYFIMFKKIIYDH